MQNKVVSHEAWAEARKRHLVEEKKFTKLRDQLSQARPDLPWELIEKEYVLEGPQGKRTLDQLFATERRRDDDIAVPASARRTAASPFVPDSPLEGGVTSELVSGIRGSGPHFGILFPR